MFKRNSKKPSVPQIHSLVVQLDNEVESRTETLFGREWTVIPVVAMVEGVRFGAAQDEPELGLASEFGANTVLWNNRPIVLNHPMRDGSFLSANQDPEILEEYYFGITMNAYVEDDKLKMEAWIDNDRVEELGGDFADIVTQITSGDDMVEVSVGFFSDLEPKKGIFNGQSYSGIWREIRPDHLAILTGGKKGACSNKDGCGIPRINEEKLMAKTPTTLKKVKPNCSCGGHAQEESSDESVAENAEEGASSKSEPAFEAQEAEARAETRSTIKKLVDQMVAGDILSSDIAKVVTRALQKKYGSYVYCYGFTTTYVIFERYNYDRYPAYAVYKLGINVSTDGKVEFVGEPEEVVLLTKIVSVDDGTTLVAQSSKSEVPTQENDMTTVPSVPKVQSADEIAEAAKLTGSPTPTPTTVIPETVTPQAAAPAPEPKKLTAQEYIDQAPPEIRDLLQASLKAQNDRKAAAIATIKANSKNKLSDATLNAMSVDDLENLVELSGAEVSYAGRAPAKSPAPAVQTAFVAAPKVFEAPKPAVAA